MDEELLVGALVEAIETEEVGVAVLGDVADLGFEVFELFNGASLANPADGQCCAVCEHGLVDDAGASVAKDVS